MSRATSAGKALAIGGGGRDERFNGGVTIDASKMPKSTKSYSEWVTEMTDMHLTQENPTQGQQHYQANKEIYWQAWADWAAKNVAQLSDSLFLFMADQNSWIFKFFPIKINRATRFVQQSIEVHQSMPHIGTRKVPFPKISATVISREAHAVYTGQGFSMDYHFMKTSEGREAWDMMVDAVTANLWSFIIYNALNELTLEPSFYRRANQLYPFDSVPRTVDELFAWEQTNLFIVNKQPQAFHSLIAGAGRVMAQKQINCTGLIVARDDLWFAHGRDPTQCFYDKSGPVSLRARVTAGQEKVIDGVTIYPIPLGSGYVHDSTFSQILQSVIQKGSFVRFPELTQTLQPSEYTSEKRSVRFSSTTRNGMTKYTLLDALSHSPEFYPLDNSLRDTDLMEYGNAFGDEADSDDGEDSGESSDEDFGSGASSGGSARTRRLREKRSNPAGKLNRELLYSLINDKDDIFSRKLRTSLRENDGKNMDRINQFIRYNKNPRLSSKQKLYPIHVFGELAECNVKTKYLAHVNRTMEDAMFMGIDKSAMLKFEKGMRLARELNRSTNSAAIELIARAVDERHIVVACADLSKREKFADDGSLVDSPDSLMCTMVAPTPQGGMPLDVAKLATITGEGVRKIRPFGFGNIAGFMTLIALDDATELDFFNAEDMAVIRDFVDVYKQIVANMRLCCRGHPGLSPSMIPLYHNSPEMTDNTRVLIAAWYTIFSHFITPSMLGVRGNSRAGRAVAQAEAQADVSAARSEAAEADRARYAEVYYILTGDSVPAGAYNTIWRTYGGASPKIADFMRALRRESQEKGKLFEEAFVVRRAERYIDHAVEDMRQKVTEADNGIDRDLRNSALATAVRDLKQLSLTFNLRISEIAKTVRDVKARGAMQQLEEKFMDDVNRYTTNFIRFFEENKKKPADDTDARAQAAHAKRFSASKIDEPFHFVNTTADFSASDAISMANAGLGEAFDKYIEQEVTAIIDASGSAFRTVGRGADTDGRAREVGILSQLTFERLGASGHFHHARLGEISDDGAVLGERHIYNGNAGADHPFEEHDEQMFGGSIFTALPFVHPALPLLERSGDIGASLRERTDLGRVNISTERGPRFRNGTAQNGKVLYDKSIYTKSFYDMLLKDPLLLRYPEFVTHIIANPLVQYDSREVSDFEARYIGTFSMPASLGVAARCLLLTPINLQMLTTMFDHNIAIPLGAMLIRPFETQGCFSAIAVSGEAIGTTYFSGFDNTVAFDPLSQHFTMQAFLWMRAMVAQNDRFLVLPCIRGGAFLGGKGHLFVNNNASQPLNRLPQLVEAISACDGEALGVHSIIAVSDTYNNAIEKQEAHHFDLRNNYRRENFAGRLHHAPRDFVELREDIVYAGAPILNTLFDWNFNDTTPMEDQSFAQQMRGLSRNFHVHEALSEVWDGKKGCGWKQTKSYHPWGATDTENCLDVQQSHSAVVLAN
jgi:hypothetical protein